VIATRRYRKYSRDISQALWTIGSSEEAGEDEDDCDDGTGDETTRPSRKRKGRGSVEEIVQEAVNRVLVSKSCRMHPCGREDIDVRMLGNGRPVVIEVIASQVIPNQRILDEIVRSINSSEGLNTERDIDLVCLTRV
jgi:tRNA U54 and U55 pseudouridine synthase Pus10